MNAQLDKDLAETLDAFNQAESWFDYFAENATLYPLNELVPVKGRQAYQENFAGPIPRRPSRTRVIESDHRMIGNTAVVVQLIEIEQEEMKSLVRESLIWRRGNAGWKVHYLHATEGV